MSGVQKQRRSTAEVDKAGKITWRYRGEMYSIGIGRTHTGTRVIVLSQDLEPSRV